MKKPAILATAMTLAALVVVSVLAQQQEPAPTNPQRGEGEIVLPPAEIDQSGSATPPSVSGSSQPSRTTPVRTAEPAGRVIPLLPTPSGTPQAPPVPPVPPARPTPETVTPEAGSPVEGEIAPAIPVQGQGQNVLDFEEGSSLSRVLRILATEAGINYIEPDIDPRETIAFRLEGMSPREAFYEIAKSRGFRVVEHNGIVELYREDIKTLGSLTTVRYHLKHVAAYLVAQAVANYARIPLQNPKEFLPTIPTPQETMGTGVNSSSASSSAGTTGSSTSQAGTTIGGTIQSRFIPTFPFDAPLNGGTKANEPSMYLDQSANAIVVRATQEIHDQLAAYIAALDVQQDQIIIQAQILQVQNTDLESLGTQWAIAYGKLQLPNGTTTPLVSFNADQAVTNSTIFGTTQPNGAIGGFAYTTLTSLVNGVSVGLRDFQVQAMIDLLRRRGRVNTLQKTQVITRSGVPTYIGSIVEEPIETVNFSAATNPAVPGATPTIGSSGVQSFITGITLDVYPVILDDGTIDINITPNVSSKIGSKTGATGQSLPIISRQTVPSSAILRSGETIPIGGLLQYAVSNDRNDVPYLNKIPFLGDWLFRRKQTNINRQNLIVLVTPYILKKNNTIVVYTTPDETRTLLEGRANETQYRIQKYRRQGPGPRPRPTTSDTMDYSQGFPQKKSSPTPSKAHAIPSPSPPAYATPPAAYSKDRP